MIAHVLEYDWVLTRLRWRLHYDGHEAVEEDFQFQQTDACFPSSHLTASALQGIKAYLDQHGLNPRVFMVVSCSDMKDAYGVLRFEAHQVSAAVLTKLFCS